jgi:hypothetical protein
MVMLKAMTISWSDVCLLQVRSFLFIDHFITSHSQEKTGHHIIIADHRQAHIHHYRQFRCGRLL